VKELHPYRQTGIAQDYLHVIVRWLYPVCRCTDIVHGVKRDCILALPLSTLLSISQAFV